MAKLSVVSRNLSQFQQRWAVAALLALLTTSAAYLAHTRHLLDRDPSSRRPNVVLFVLDTVRRDRVTPCGEVRPITPNLQKLANLGRTYCAMVTPGSWTLPVHASIFTGHLPTDHYADFVPEGIRPEYGGVLSVSGMRPDLPTLAGRFSEAGYQTVFISANPVLSKNVGIMRDFDATWTSVRLKEAVARRMKEILNGSVRRGAPLFLVVNIILAHGPFEPVPAGNGLIESTPALIDLIRDGPEGLFGRFVRGELPPAARAALLDTLPRAYDWGVHLADADLGQCMAELLSGGWTTEDSVIAVTSDHGEILGEHGLLDHGRTVIRPNIDVFAVVVGPGFEPGSRSDVPTQSQDLYPTLLEAAGLQVPPLSHARSMRELRVARVLSTVSQPDDYWLSLSSGAVGGTRYAAVQEGNLRVVLSDPGDVPVWETAGGKVLSGGVTGRDDLLAQARKLMMEARQVGRVEVRLDPSEMEALRALGYAR